jgi:hypothetical protein
MATRLVVEWTRLTLRLAAAEGAGARLRVRAIHAQTNSAPEQAVESLRSLLKSAKITAAEVIGVVAREQVITRVVRFPATDPAELSSMVELYAKAQLPYPREQTVMDFHVLQREAGFSTVAVVACQRDVIDRHIAVLQGAGLTVNLLTLSSWGVLGWYRQAKAAGVEEPCLVVNVDDARTDLVLVQDGRILSSRSIGQGVIDWAGAGDTIELLALEVERSRAAVRKELPQVDARSILLTGQGAPEQWSGALSRRVGLPVTAFEARQALKGCVIPTSPPISPVVAGGVGASDVRSLLNLSPTEMRAQVTHRKQVQELVTVGFLLLTVLALGSWLLSLRVSRQHRLAAQLESVIAEVHPTAKDMQEKSRSHQLVAGILEHRERLGRTLADVFSSTPGSVSLEAVTFERARGELVVRGNAVTTVDVLSYIKQLEQISGIEGVRLRYSTRRSTPSGDRTDFELVMTQKHA